jgi:glycerophosphoryl diester phosphodiesterase
MGIDLMVNACHVNEAAMAGGVVIISRGLGMTSLSRTRWFWLACLLLIILSPSAAWSGQTPDLTGEINRVQLIAHRGYHVEAPENSLASLQAAIDLGIAGCEVDLRTSKDGHLVLIHDATLDRTTTGSGNVSEYLLSDLKQLYLKHKKSGTTRERIPTLEEALKLLKKTPGFRLSLDLIDADPARTAHMISDHGVAQQVVLAVSSPHKVDQVRAIQDIDPRLKVSVDILMWWKIEGLPTFTVKSLGVQALFASEWFFPRYGFDEAREAGAEVIVFLYGDHDLRERLQRAVKLGAQVISSDRPDLLKMELEILQAGLIRQDDQVHTYTKP